MPGMMDAISPNDITVEGLARVTTLASPGIPIAASFRWARGTAWTITGSSNIPNWNRRDEDTQLAQDWHRVAGSYKVIEAETGKPFPQDRRALGGAIARCSV